MSEAAAAADDVLGGAAHGSVAVAGAEGVPPGQGRGTAVPARSVSPGFCRVTVVGARHRVDLAVPELVPLAELLPDLARLSGASPAAVLARLGQPPLDPARSLADAGVLDGELLYLSEPGAAPQPAVVDDLGAVVADEVERTAAPWTAGTAARALVALAVLVAATALLVPLRRSGAAAGLVVLVLGALLLAVAPVLRRRAPGPYAPLRATLGVAAAAGGVLALVAGADVLARAGGAGTGARTAAVAGALAVGALAAALVSPALLAAGLALGTFAGGTALALLGDVRTGAGPAACAAATTVVALALTALTPVLAARSSGVALGVLRQEQTDEPPAAAQVAEQRSRVRTGLAVLSGLLVGLGVLLAGAVVVLALRGGVFALVLAALVGLLSAYRARDHRSRTEVLALLLPAAAALTGLLARLLLDRGDTLAVLVLVPLAVAGALLAGLRALPGRLSPGGVVLLDRLALLSAVACVPVALGAMRVYGAVNALGVRLHG